MIDELFHGLLTSVPLILAATGELVAEKSGVLNLGVEGMMLMGAVAAFGAALVSGSPYLDNQWRFGWHGNSRCFCAVYVGFGHNQVATGLALTIFGTGLSGLIGAPLVEQPSKANLVAIVTGTNVCLRGGFKLDIMAYGCILLVALTAWFLFQHVRALSCDLLE